MAENLDIEDVYDRHAQALFAFVLNLTRNEAETRDVIQEVFLRLVEKPEILANARNERGFLLGLAHNLVVDAWRRRESRQKREHEYNATGDAVFAATSNIDQTEFQHALGNALNELPPDQRAVVHLKLWEGFTLDAIAKTLGIPSNTAASRYRYGLDKLRERLRLIYEEIR